MNRRDALKSLLAAPVAAAAVPAEPQKFDIWAYFASPEFYGPHFLDLAEPRPGYEIIILETGRLDPTWHRLQIHHRTHNLAANIHGVRIWDAEHKLRTLSDSGRRDAKGRRIFA